MKDRNKGHFTIYMIHPEIAKKARVIAIEKGTSISRIIENFLTDFVRNNEKPLDKS